MPSSYPASYPATRLRRTRASAWSRALYRETALTPSDLIWPLFVTEGKGVEEPVGSLPGVSRWSLDGIAARAREAVGLGIPCLALFPNTPVNLRSDEDAKRLIPTI
jgi:porphobilinogen synthase